MQKERETQDVVIDNLKKAIDKFKEELFHYTKEKIDQKEENQIAKLKSEQSAKQAKDEKEKLGNKLDDIKTRNTNLSKECNDLKVQIADKDDKFARLMIEKEEIEKDIQKKEDALNDERAKRSKIEAELTMFTEENRAIGGMDIRRLNDRNKELEEENKILQSQRVPVVAYNKEFGTMEYIGAPQYMEYGIKHQNRDGLPNTVQDVTKKMKEWLGRESSNNNRLSVKGIFHSMDRGNFGELKEDAFV